MSAPLATHLLVTARTADSEGISLFLVDLDRAGPGLDIHGYRTVDDRRAADLVIDGLRLPARRAARRGGAGVGVAGPGARRRRRRDLRGSGRVHAQGAGRHRRILQTAPAVRAADRQLPGAAAPHGGHVHGARAGRRGGVPRGPEPRRRAGDPRTCGVGREGDRSGGPPGSSARTRCSCTAGWA